MIDKTGGPAFARPYGGHPDPAIGDPEMQSQEGMTLRDYFAAKYMQAHVCGWLANDNDYPNRENVAAYAYAQADAMLAQRSRS